MEVRHKHTFDGQPYTEATYEDDGVPKGFRTFGHIEEGAVSSLLSSFRGRDIPRRPTLSVVK